MCGRACLSLLRLWNSRIRCISWVCAVFCEQNKTLLNAIKLITLLSIEFPQLSNSKATVAKNPNSIRRNQAQSRGQFSSGQQTNKVSLTAFPLSDNVSQGFQRLSSHCRLKWPKSDFLMTVWTAQIRFFQIRKRKKIPNFVLSIFIHKWYYFVSVIFGSWH